MKGIWAAVVATLVLLVASWGWLQQNTADARGAARAMAAFTDYVRAENALHRDVLSARSGTLRNYDPIVRELAVMHGAVARLRDAPGEDFRREAEVLAALAAAEEALVERFKSTDALLTNSLAYFTRLTGEMEGVARVAPQLNGLATAVLHVSADASALNLARLDEAIARFDPPPGEEQHVAALVAHARQLRLLLPEMAGVLGALADLGSGRDVEAVRASLLARQATLAARGDVGRMLLYAVALVLVGLLAWAGVQLRARIRALRRRAGIEHVVAKISMRFLRTPSWRMEESLTLALQELALCFGARRATFVVVGAPRPIISCSDGAPPFPPGWCDEVVALMGAAGLGDGGVLHIEDLRANGAAHRLPRAAVAAGVASWLSVARVRGGAVQAVLVLDSHRARAFRAFDADRLLALAFDALTNAVAKTALEDERQRLEAHLQHAKRIETVGVFASGIAHNFNNIIGAIAGHAEMAATEAGSEERLAGHVHAIQVAAERARQLVDQVLGFGRRSESARRPVAVADLVEETVSLLATSLPATVAVEVCLPDEPLVVEAEPAQLQQVLLNLCRNAADAVDGDGRVTLGARAATAGDGACAPDGLPPGRYVVIVVEDDGRGMDETTLARIFEPFFTTRRDGNGLGLATALEVARAHRGGIEVASTPGEGSRFSVWLPAAAADVLPAPGGAGGGEGRGAGETVMLVEADGERRLGLEDVLAALGYEPVGFGDLEAAAAAARASPARFDAAVVCGGRAAGGIAALCEAVPGLPVILSAPASDAWTTERLTRAGIAALIPYPPTSMQLADALAARLRGRTIAAGPAIGGDRRAG